MARQKPERKEALMRIIVAIVSGIILYAWSYLTAVLIILNWLVALISGKRSRDIAEFVEYWNTSSYNFSRYMSGVTNARPFPFTKLHRISKFEK